MSHYILKKMITCFACIAAYLNNREDYLNMYLVYKQTNTVESVQSFWYFMRIVKKFAANK